MTSEFKAVLKYVKNVLEDVIEELDQPEVAELTSLALDRKLERVTQLVQEYLDNEQAD